MTALEVSGLDAAYGTTQVLGGVDLSVSHGITAVLGPSGCGKTTLLRIVAGFVAPTAGEVSVAGHRVATPTSVVPARRRHVSYVPQEGALFPHLTVLGNIVFGLPRRQRRCRSTAADARVLKVLEMVELPANLLGRHPHELSGGQQQRVALARALITAPPLVLLDEPFASLDAGLREGTGRSVVAAIRAAGAAAVLVTHDQGEALSLADQVAVLGDGRLLQVAEPRDLYLRPASERVAAFLGHSTLLPASTAGGTEATSALGMLTLSQGRPAGLLRAAVRAEQVQIRPDGQGTAARVVDVSFFGHDATVRVRLKSGEVVAARIPNDRVPRAGELVAVEVVGSVTAFPVEEGET